jgi:hypothetical protein
MMTGSRWHPLTTFYEFTPLSPLIRHAYCCEHRGQYPIRHDSASAGKRHGGRHLIRNVRSRFVLSSNPAFAVSQEPMDVKLT